MGAIALTIDHAKIAFPTAPLIAPRHAVALREGGN
jgi:hypothetical protein